VTFHGPFVHFPTFIEVYAAVGPPAFDVAHPERQPDAE
jgi:hypothetical protein